MNNQSFFIGQCRRLIEQKLGWGNSDDWQNQDFDTLSEKIFEVTGVSISTSTLKRIWGKVKYESSPNLSTLNALSLFVGYENWRAFTSSQLQTEAIATSADLGTKSTTNYKNLYWIITGIVLLICFFGFRVFKNKNKSVNYSNLVFTSKPVTAGLPNTVVFEYDAAKSNADSVFIQQSWDKRLRTKVDRSLHQFTCTYYRPGFYKAELLLNDSLVKEHDLFIESDGWLALIESGVIPIYFTKQEIIRTGAIGVTEEEVKAKGMDFKNEIPWISFYDIKKDKHLAGDHFELQTEIKNTFKSGNGICQKTAIAVLGKNGVIVIPLAIKGCVGELNLVIGKSIIKGKTNDLSGFGVDFSDFVQIHCIIKDKKIKITVNDKTAYEADFTQDIGEIVGEAIQFNGTGLIKSCVIKSI